MDDRRDLEDVAARIVEAAEPERLVRAIMTGVLADEEFSDQCAARGLRSDDAIRDPEFAPSDFMELPIGGARH
jgi:hypothetical protein